MGTIEEGSFHSLKVGYKLENFQGHFCLLYVRFHSLKVGYKQWGVSGYHEYKSVVFIP